MLDGNAVSAREVESKGASGKEKDSIRAAILGTFATGLADEITVVNNNAALGTSEEVAGTGAHGIFEPEQGYGHALLCGAGLIVLLEPDDTFSPNDLVKLLAYSDDMISPLLSNLYLNEVDQMLERAKAVTRRERWTAVEYARFADDLVILVDSQPRQQWLRQAVEKRLREEFTRLQVEVNEEKSRKVDLQQGESFGFLGFEFRRIRSRRGRWMPLLLPKGAPAVEPGSRSGRIGPITLDVKCAGARSAGNPLATCDEAGAGIRFTVRLVRHSQRKRGAMDRPDLRNHGASPRPYPG